MKLTLAVIFLTVKRKKNRKYIFIALMALMGYLRGMITHDQIRAARAIIGWKQTDLAKAAGVSEMSIKNIERGKTDSRMSTVQAIQTALEQAGVEFISDDRGEGVVKLRAKGLQP